MTSADPAIRVQLSNKRKASALKAVREAARPPFPLWPVAVLYTGVLALWFGLGERLGRVGFYLLFAPSP